MGNEYFRGFCLYSVTIFTAILSSRGEYPGMTRTTEFSPVLNTVLCDFGLLSPSSWRYISSMTSMQSAMERDFVMASELIVIKEVELRPLFPSFVSDMELYAC